MCGMDAEGDQETLVRELVRLFDTGFEVPLIRDQVIGRHDQHGRIFSNIVITSYSIHYTKLYELFFVI